MIPFIITIDTEGDNEWGRNSHIRTNNASYIPRFQSLCEKHGFKPVYLTNYDMAMSAEFQEIGRAALSNRMGEIGMHLHAWSTPPIEDLTGDDRRHHPYLIDFSPEMMVKKVDYMTSLLQEVFQVQPVSHRAGRWSFNGAYARALLRAGYRVDCSVTPHVTWVDSPGAPNGEGGTDFTGCPEAPYFLDLNDISRAGNSPLLEVPMTIRVRGGAIGNRVKRITARGPSLARRVANRIFPSHWIRPNGRNLNEMLAVLRQCRSTRARHIEFMLHSSELMPGGSPTFKSQASVETLYCHLDETFAAASEFCAGATLAEFYDQCASAMGEELDQSHAVGQECSGSVP